MSIPLEKYFMQPLKITASVANAFAVYDNWSPSLDSLLEWLILDRLNLTQSNPTNEQIAASRPIVDQNMPLLKGEISGEWYWSVSSPCYILQSEYTDKYRKRWDSHDKSLNWGKRKAKFTTSEGPEKSYDLPLFCRVTDSISWYGVGDKDNVSELLANCTRIGKKRSQGNGEISQWIVEPIKEDWHLWRNKELMRPMPFRLLFTHPNMLASEYYQLDWGWRHPAWHTANKELCFMPKCNVVRV